MRVAYVMNTAAGGSAAAAPMLTTALKELGVTLLEMTWKDGPLSEADAAVLSSCDMAVVLGGDGSIMHTAKNAAAFGVPVLGVNGGTIGFMAGLEMHQLDRLSRLLEGRFTIETRMMLDVKLERREETLAFTALNEAVVVQQLQHAHGGDRLTGAGFTDNAQNLTGVHGVADIVDSLDNTALGVEEGL